MAKMGFAVWLLLSVMTSQGVWGRPKDVKLITEPRPGQEYVNIQSSVFRQQPEARKIANQTEADFATSHKIPGDLPVEDDGDYAEEEAEDVSAKIKRESESLLEALLTPDEVLPEVRMEFSVVTSKPRKETKDSVDKASRGSVKAGAPSEKKATPKPGATVKDVEIDSKGNFGKLPASVSGADEKKVMLKKQAVSEATATAAEKVAVAETLKEVEIKPASEVGVKSPKVEKEAGAITVPIQKQQSASSNVQQATATVTPLTSQPPTDKGFDILPVNHIAKKLDSTKDVDFDFVDSPLGDKVLVPAGSNQQSRIEVKKGPNGQDYEYEYVYYYYDDDENDTVSDDKKTVNTKTSTAATTTAAPTTTSRHYLPEAHHEKDAGDHARGRGRNRNQAHLAAPEVAEAEKEFGGRTKYAAIERTKEAAAPDTSNEIIPARGTPTRSRGRTVAAVTTEEPSTVAAEERLPSNTRFPPRSRSNHNSNSVSATTPLPHTPDAPVTRVRSGASANSVRRPSLELVDSSSFKTHSSDASRDQDLRPEFPSSLPDANDEEEPIKPRGSRVRGTTTTPAAVVDYEEEDADISDAPRRGQPSRRPSVGSRTAADEEEEDDVIGGEVASEPLAGSLPVDSGATKVTAVGLPADVMDKAAIELYSLLQQAQAENSIDESTDLSEEDLTTELEDLTTTQEPTTSTTTTTTTTPAPTTSTTTTTEEPSTTTGRGRYRQRAPAGAPRNRFRSNAGSSVEVTSTTEAPVEASTRARARFGSNRVTSGNYGRRGFQKSTTSAPEDDSDKEVEAVREVASAAPAVRTSAFSRNRFSATRPARVTSTTTSAPSDDSGSATSSSSAPAKPFADRFSSLRRRGGAKASSTTAAPAAEETKSESSGEETNEPATVSEALSTTAKPQGRTRLSIGSGPRPVRPSPRVNIGGRGRLGATTTTSTTQAPSTELDEASNEQTSSSSQDDTQSQSDEAQEVQTTVAPDALTRLRNRPRLRVNAARPVSTTTTAPIRRPLGLLPRRRPQTAEAKDSSESETQDSSNASSNSEESQSSSSSDETSEPSTDATSSATTAQDAPPENNRLSSLLGGRRKGHALRRPQSQFSAGGR